MKTSLNFILPLLVIFTTPFVDAGTVIKDGRTWMQVTDTTNISYAQMDAIFDTSTGQLDGINTTIGTIDFTGWTWASMDDLYSLANSYVGGGTLTAFDTSFFELDSLWAPTIFNDFDYTFNSTVMTRLNGFSRTVTGDLSTMLAVIERHDGNNDVISEARNPITLVNPTIGHFLYQTPVPVPATVWLMGSGLLGLLGIGRKNRIQAAAA